VLHDVLCRDLLENADELLQRISSHFCRAPIPDVRWLALEQSAGIGDLIFCAHPLMQPDLLTHASPAVTRRLPMPRGARVVCRQR
jgi:hypothetical protein